jgi:hypothetical protein
MDPQVRISLAVVGALIVIIGISIAIVARRSYKRRELVVPKWASTTLILVTLAGVFLLLAAAGDKGRF